MMSSIRNFVVPLALLSALAGCSSDSTRGNCPATTALVETSTLTAFRPGTVTDPTYALYTAEIVSVDGECDWSKRDRTADASQTIHFRATRAPNGTAVSYSLPYFVSVVEGGRILAKRSYTAQFSFDAGQAVADFSEDIDPTEIKVEHGKQIFDYAILVGLQLTKEQLDYNHAMGRY